MLFVCSGVFGNGNAGYLSHEKSPPTVTAFPQSFHPTPLVMFPWWSLDSSQMSTPAALVRLGSLHMIVCLQIQTKDIRIIDPL